MCRRLGRAFEALVVGALLAGLSVSCASPASEHDAAPNRESGVTGLVTVDRGCPLLEGTQTCPRDPLVAEVSAYRGGRLVSSTQSDSRGDFRLVLEPGRYELRGGAVDGAPVPTMMPVMVVVEAGDFTRIRLEFDSGVRGAPS